MFANSVPGFRIRGKNTGLRQNIDTEPLDGRRALGFPSPPQKRDCEKSLNFPRATIRNGMLFAPLIESFIHAVEV